MWSCAPPPPPPGGFRLGRWPLLRRGPVVSPGPVTLRVSDPPRRPAVSGVARPALPPRLSGQGRPASSRSAGGLSTRGGGESTKGLTHVLRTRAPPGPVLALQQPEIAKSSLGKVGGEALGRRRGKQVKREGRGGVTAHKSPSPTLGPHRSGAPAPREMEGHSATPGRPLSSPRASAPP